MASFPAKIGWKMSGKREYKKYRFVLFLPNAKQKIPKKLQKNSKVLKMPLWLHFKQKQVGKGSEREKIKIIITFRSYPTRNSKFQQNNKKIRKTKKYHYDFILSENRLEKDEKDRK